MRSRIHHREPREPVRVLDVAASPAAWSPGLDEPLKLARAHLPFRLSIALLLTLTSLCGAENPVVRVGYGTAPPLMYRDEAGRPRGFFVEAMEEAGRRAGYRIEWAARGSMPSNNGALSQGKIDMITGPVTAERARLFSVSEPWWFAEIVAMVPAGSGINQDSQLNGRVLAVTDSVAAAVSRHYRGSAVALVGSAKGAAEAVCSGKAEAAVIPGMYLRELAFAASPVCRDFPLRTIDSTARIEYALISRPEMAGIARTLKNALDEIAADGTLAVIAGRHPPTSTPQAARLAELLRLRFERRISRIYLGAVSIIAALCAVFILKQRRSNSRLRHDLAARMRAEAALRDSEARFRALFDSAPQTVLAIGPDGGIAFVNHRVEEMFGHVCEQLTGKDMETLLPEHLREDFRQNRFAGRAETKGLRADGREFPIEITFGKVNSDERLTLAFIADISERVALQQQLMQAQKLESVGRLTGGVAHDFNNLLTIIGGYAQMALDTLGAQENLREPLNEIARAGERASGLTRQLLMFSRRQTGSPRIISLNDLIGNLQKMLRRLIGEDVEVIVDLSPEAPYVNVDPNHIEQVIMNLALNARDAMPEGGQLVIATARFHTGGEYSASCAGLAAGEYALMKVTDNGTGMAADVQAHMFEPFFTTKQQGKGTGLGLSTVYGIVTHSKGAILVHSEPGKGSTFEILLPAAEAGPEGAEAGTVEPIPNLAGTEMVLVAEDETGVRSFVSEVLRSQGYSVLEASNGKAALEVAGCNDPIHLLLTDMVMPEMGGADLARRFAEIHPGRPILLMSGYNDRILQTDQARSLLEKPFTPSTLLRRIREALDGRGNTPRATGRL